MVVGRVVVGRVVVGHIVVGHTVVGLAGWLYLVLWCLGPGFGSWSRGAGSNLAYNEARPVP
jgi:hypothetical protein